MKELNLLWMYPDILNLHGDRGNIMAFEKIADMHKVKLNIKRIENYGDKIDFENADIIFFNPGELKVLPSIIKSLTEQKQQLDEYIEKNKIIVVIGTTGAIMSKKINRKNGEIIEGLGYLDMQCNEKEIVEGDDIIITLQENKNVRIGGCQIQIMDTILNSEEIAIGSIEYGMGNDKKGKEGAKYKNLIFTNILGPLFVKNPWYTENLIIEALKNKGIEECEDIERQEYSLEKDSLKLLSKFIDKKRE